MLMLTTLRRITRLKFQTGHQLLKLVLEKKSHQLIKIGCMLELQHLLVRFMLEDIGYLIKQIKGVGNLTHMFGSSNDNGKHESGSGKVIRYLL
jgi:hypothetical protein